MKCAVITLGCKVNQCESESLARKMENLGHEIVGHNEKADVYIVNTCFFVMPRAKENPVRRFAKPARLTPMRLLRLRAVRHSVHRKCLNALRALRLLRAQRIRENFPK